MIEAKESNKVRVGEGGRSDRGQGGGKGEGGRKVDMGCS